MNGKRLRRAVVTAVSALGLGAGLWIMGARSASGEPPAGPPDDGVPPGTVAFFAGGKCPDGWKEAEDARGRLVAGVIKGDHAGVTVGEPLGDREERAHQHGYAGQVTIADKAIAAADGANQSGAAAKTYDIQGTTTKDVSGLPFVQVMACEKP